MREIRPSGSGEGAVLSRPYLIRNTLVERLQCRDRLAVDLAITRRPIGAQIGGSLEDGAPIIQFKDNGGLNQRWRFEDSGGGFFKIISLASGRSWPSATARRRNPPSSRCVRNIGCLAVLPLLGYTNLWNAREA